MNYISQPTLFGAAIELLPHVADAPFGTLDDLELQDAVSLAVKLAKMVGKEFSNSAWGPTIKPLPRIDIETPQKSDSKDPEWIRIPSKGKCPHTGLSRGTLYNLIGSTKLNDYRPPVKSVLLRQKGNIRGVRLISYASLMEYLSKEANNPRQE